MPSATLAALRAFGASRLDFGGANVRNGWAKFTLNDAVSSDKLVVRLSAACDTSGAIQRPSDQARRPTLRAHATPPARRRRRTEYTVFQAAASRSRVHAANDADAALTDQVSTSVGFTSRQALQQALDERSDGQRAHGRRQGRVIRPYSYTDTHTIGHEDNFMSLGLGGISRADGEMARWRRRAGWTSGLECAGT